MTDRRTAVSDAWRILRQDGARGLAIRAVRLGYQRLGASTLDFPLLAHDVADSTRLQLPTPDGPTSRTRPATIGWVMTPPSLGSGGHTTLFRMIEAVEAAGHPCVLYLYDRFAGEIDRHADIVRRGWPRVRAEVRDVSDGLAPLDGYVATGWQTAHVLARRSPFPTRRFYFVQDFEPFFFARGSEYALAEDSYRFGFHCIALGRMVADLLRSEAGVESTLAPFGCDTDIYRLTNTGDRRGVVFYTKPDVPRRGYQMAVLALAEFNRAHPDQPIHVFGQRVAELPFPVVDHANMTPRDLNSLYNESIAGLAMSFTNISLVAEEMLAAGAVPIVNDSRYSRADLPSIITRWAAPTPGAIADALSDAVSAPDLPRQAVEAARSVRAGWAPAQAVVLETLERDIFG